jgi:hypothetical protein
LGTEKRARELGLSRTKELPWNEAELAILSRYAWMSDERIRLKLKAAGYARAVTAVHLKLKRMRFKHDGSFYSANGLAQTLGIDPHAVTRWIKSGHLKAKFRGTERGPRLLAASLPAATEVRLELQEYLAGPAWHPRISLAA